MKKAVPEFFIVGGGPAGSSTAARLASHGRSVLVVEKSDYSGLRIGETVPPAARRVLEELGLNAQSWEHCSLRSPGTVCVWGNDIPYRNDFLYDPHGAGLHLDRSAFDLLLRDHAAASGADFWMNATVKTCTPIDGGWRVTVRCHQGERTLEPRVLIDASGSHSWRGRLVIRSALDRQIAMIAIFKPNALADTDHWTWIESAQCGWWYTTRLPNGHMATVFFTDPDLLSRTHRTPDVLFNELLSQTTWTRQRTTNQGRIAPLRTCLASCSIGTPLCGENWVAVGDAASTMDPLSGQGIFYAITSGLRVADALVGSSPSKVLLTYQQAITERFHEDLIIRAEFYGRETRWADSPFWQRRMSSAMTAARRVDGVHLSSTRFL